MKSFISITLTLLILLVNIQSEDLTQNAKALKAQKTMQNALNIFYSIKKEESEKSKNIKIKTINKLIRETMDIVPGHPIYWKIGVDILTKTNNPDQALLFCNELIEKYYQYADTHFYYDSYVSEIYFLKNELDKSKLHFNKAFNFFSTTPFTSINLSTIPVQALPHLQVSKMAFLLRERAQYQNNILKLGIKFNQIQEMLKKLYKKNQEKNYEAQLVIYNDISQIGNFEEKVMYLDYIIEKYPTNYTTYEIKTTLYMTDKNHHEEYKTMLDILSKWITIYENQDETYQTKNLKNYKEVKLYISSLELLLQAK